MISKISTGLNIFALISVALSGLVLANSWPVCAGTSNIQVPHGANQHSNSIVVAQSQNRVSTPETDPSTSESSESESQSPEEKDPAASKKKPLKDFQPTERIEADQAVDFPYDI